MTVQSGGIGATGSVPWALGHPGFTALLSALAAVLGLIGVFVGLAVRTELAQTGMPGQLSGAALLFVSALAFVVGLPTSLGFAGASCATQRELWPGILGGLTTILVTLVVVGLVLPVHGFA